jgi:hypothetical protein
MRVHLYNGIEFYQQVLNILIARTHDVLNLQQNRRYYESAKEQYLAPFNERYSSSMDVESKFSDLNRIMGRDGRYSSGISTTHDTLLSVKKLVLCDKVDTKRPNSSVYKDTFFCKTVQDLLKWNDGSKYQAIARRDSGKLKNLRHSFVSSFHR